jgi:hypothetical protein
MKVLWIDNNKTFQMFPCAVNAFRRFEQEERNLKNENEKIGEVCPGWFIIDPSDVVSGIDNLLLLIGQNIDKYPKRNLVVIKESVCEHNTFYIFFVNEEVCDCDNDANITGEVVELLTNLYREKLVSEVTSS